MKEGETDWVDMQVPDGTQWLEYMLVRGRTAAVAQDAGNVEPHCLGRAGHE